ncbi:MAG: ATP-binding cassette domain-containing protein [Lachnospiraceae bacterium]|nr:ATP-binding cassette domain-containing protein [Lachnospiraceae bacterium]
MALKVNIKKKYRDFLLDIKMMSTGRRIGILGASGSGKSLTLKSIAGLIKPDEGTVEYDGRVLFDHRKRINIRAEKRGAGYLFQNYALFPDMTVKGNINAALHGAQKQGRLSKDRPRDTDEILKGFGLFEIRDHMPAELSGGQKQRTALARVLVTNPDLLLLDEPFSAIDMHLRERLRTELIGMLDTYDKTVVFVSHDRDEIYQICDALILIDNGKVIAQGKTYDLFEQPETVSAARLTGCKNISRVIGVSKHRVKALDWNDIELVTDSVVTDDITHIGIRAHDFIPGMSGVNDIRCGVASVSRLPFEWYITLENGLWWKLERKHYDGRQEINLPEYVSISPERILLLKG